LDVFGLIDENKGAQKKKEKNGGGSTLYVINIMNFMIYFSREYLNERKRKVDKSSGFLVQFQNIYLHSFTTFC